MSWNGEEAVHLCTCTTSKAKLFTTCYVIVLTITASRGSKHRNGLPSGNGWPHNLRWNGLSDSRLRSPYRRSTPNSRRRVTAARERFHAQPIDLESVGGWRVIESTLNSRSNGALESTTRGYIDRYFANDLLSSRSRSSGQCYSLGGRSLGSWKMRKGQGTEEAIRSLPNIAGGTFEFHGDEEFRNFLRLLRHASCCRPTDHLAARVEACVQRDDPASSRRTNLAFGRYRWPMEAVHARRDTLIAVTLRHVARTVLVHAHGPVTNTRVFRSGILFRLVSLPLWSFGSARWQWLHEER